MVALRHMRQSLYIVVLLTLTAGVGCQPDAPLDQASDAHFYPLPDTAFQSPQLPDSTLQALEQLQTDVFLQAFDTLSARRFTFDVRTVQYDGQGKPQARRFRRAAVLPSGEHRILQATDSGRFHIGMLTRFVAPDTSLSPSVPTATNIVSDDPAYLSPRNREGYRFVEYPDTVAAAAVKVIDVLARPGVGDDQTIRRARLMLDTATQQLLGMYVVRLQRGALFGEQSHFFARLRYHPRDGWLPDTTRYRSQLSFPFLSDFQLEQATSYREFE